MRNIQLNTKDHERILREIEIASYGGNVDVDKLSYEIAEIARTQLGDNLIAIELLMMLAFDDEFDEDGQAFLEFEFCGRVFIDENLNIEGVNHCAKGWAIDFAIDRGVNSVASWQDILGKDHLSDYKRLTDRMIQMINMEFDEVCGKLEKLRL